MKHAYFSILFLSLCNILAADEAIPNNYLSVEAPIHHTIAYKLKGWSQLETEVYTRAREENKPILLAFVGEEFCPWSKKMISDVLAQSSFVDSISSEAILWQILLSQDGSETQNKIREKFGVKECPTLLLLDPQGREFARTGFLPLSPQKFAKHLTGIIKDFREICRAIDEKEQIKDSQKWVELYQKTGQLSVPEIKHLVLEKGIKNSEDATDILLEKYALLLEKKKFKHIAVKECREDLLKRDPENSLGTHLKVALIDFQRLAIADKLKHRPEKVLKPIFGYLKKFQNKDSQHLWKAELTAAQFLFKKQYRDKALEFARRALKHAPDVEKAQIKEAIAIISAK